MTEKDFYHILQHIARIEPSRDAYERGREHVLFALAQQQAQTVASKPTVRVPAVRRVLDRIFEPLAVVGSAMRTFALAPVTVMVLVIAFFTSFGAYAGTVARYSTPDETVPFTLKSALEKTQLALSFSTEDRAQVKVNHLARRFQEVRKVAEKVSSEPSSNGAALAKAIRNVQAQAQDVQHELDKLAEKKSEGADQETSFDQLVEKVVTYSIAASELRATLPEDVRPDVEALAQTLSEITAGIETDTDIEVGTQATANTEQEYIEGDTGESEVPGVSDGQNGVDIDTLFEMTGDVPTTTTTTLLFIGDEATGTDSTGIDLDRDDQNQTVDSANQHPVPVNQKKTEFSIEDDTKPVGIGL